MKEDSLIEENKDFLVTESIVKKDVSPNELARFLQKSKSTANITTRILEGGTASRTVVEKTRINEKQREQIRNILGME